MLGTDLGFCSAMADCRLISAADLAATCNVPEPYANQWLAAQAASGYVETDLDQESGAVTFRLSPEQAMKEGHGFGWHEHDAELFLGTEQFFRPGYRAHLVDEWLPALSSIDVHRVPLSPGFAGSCRRAGAGAGRGRQHLVRQGKICRPSSLAQDVGAAFGAQAGEARLRQAAEMAGFTRFRRATETPVNMVLELRP